MSEQPYDTDEGTETEATEKLVTLKRSEIKGIERKAKEHDQMAAQLEQAQRRLAFAEAGLPLGDKRIQYFVKGYDGELTSEAILEAAAEAGFVDKAPQDGQTTVEGQVERQTIGAVYSASQGAGAPQPGDVEAAMEAAYSEGGSEGLMNYLREAGIPVAED